MEYEPQTKGKHVTEIQIDNQHEPTIYGTDINRILIEYLLSK